MKKVISTLAALIILLFAIAGCGSQAGSGVSSEQASQSASENPLKTDLPPAVDRHDGLTAKEIVAGLTLEEKAAQMIQAAGYKVITKDEMKNGGYGSLLSMWGFSAEEWKAYILGLQEGALASSSGIPYIYGNDAVHGVNNCDGAVIFPHNIGIGAANDEELTYKMGLAVADEAKMSGMLWTFSPCVASAQDPRWGRTFESYSSDTKMVASLGLAFSKGLIDGGILPCAKHYLGDGDVMYGTGEKDMLIDRGDAILDDARIGELLEVYKTLVDGGVKTVMVTHGAVNGVKMHMHKELITDRLKGELGFTGFVVSDWESIHNMPGNSLKEQVISAVNAGIDMLMEPEYYKDCVKYIIEAVNEGAITAERVDDAVARIVSVKKEMGLFDDPMMQKLETKYETTGSAEYRDLARQLVEKSLVLLKNDNNVLPLKKGSKIFVTGDAANNTGVLCGGWTHKWEGDMDKGNTRLQPDGKTILDGFNALADEYGYTIITDPAQAGSADVTVLCIGEKPYVEWLGDTGDLSITGKLALSGNKKDIAFATELGKPVVTCIIAGRNVIYDEYEDNWDAVVMCYLPGSEGDGVANVLSGKAGFSGRLPMPYYSSVQDIRTDKVKYEIGYGLDFIQ